MAEFLHPEDAMRAKILDRLDCRWCVSFHNGDRMWCRRQHKPPVNGPMKDSRCSKFRLSPKQKLHSPPDFFINQEEW